MLKRPGFKAMLIYFGLSLITFVFGLIYTANGHGVTSNNMTYAFVPTLLAAAFFALHTFVPKLPCPQGFTALFCAFAVTCYTLDLIVKGILDIAGAYSNYAILLTIAGHAFFALFLALSIINLSKFFKN